MIRHRPLGRGHAYRIEPDQRVPVRPIEAEPLELRVTTPAGVTAVTLEIDASPGAGGRAATLPLEPFEPAADEREAGSAADDSHLAAAAAASARRGRQAWRVRLTAGAAGTRLRYRFTASDGTVTRWHEVTVAGWRSSGGSLVGTGEVWPDRLLPDTVDWLVADGRASRVRFALRLDPDAHVVGFGERFDRLDQRGQRLDAVVFEQYKSQGRRTYLPMPFAIVTPTDDSPGWGFHVRTSRRTWYDVGAGRPDRLVIEAAVDPAVSEPVLEVACYDGEPSAVLRAFLDEVGSPVRPPNWVFRLWMSGNEWNTQARVRAEVERTLAEGIPAGVVVIEAWSDETTFAAFRDAQYAVHEDGSPHRLSDFTFPPDGAWPDPKGMVDWLHESGFALLLWQVPLLRTDSDADPQAAADRRTMAARGFGVHEGDGRPYRNRGWWFPRALMPDWTNPDAARWWLEKRRYLVEDVGIDGFKTDGGEHAWGDELRYADGRRGDEGNNEYPVRYAAAYHDLMRSAGRDPVTFSRAGFTGASTVPLHWAGDENSSWSAFRASVTAGLTAGASGVVFWGWDLAGFSGEIPDPELYLRSAAMACFCPIMQYHSEFNHHRRPSRDRTPWNVAERHGDPAVLSGFRRFARLRERLLPYLEEQADICVSDRRPLMRALLFDWPTDPRIWGYPYEYLLGDALLVAPVTASFEERSAEAGTTTTPDRWPVYLPRGDWVDAWTGERLSGPVEFARAVPLDEIPVYVRAASWERLGPVFRDDDPAGG
ncbi:MAG TPA: TIM-barrel domain-containing protein [Candidatus Limnocylindrales bacterium]|nr:TIM-barrel domain-containing protein [Candidatus Limnocylindrales bacterium]